jgi:hypothetical protein
MDSPTTAQLQELVRRESLSLLSYVGDAFPWTARRGDSVLAQLRQIVAEHNRAVFLLRQLLTRRRVTPAYVGSFPSSFTSINFLAFSHVLPRLIESEGKSMALLDAEAQRVTDPEVQAALGQFLTGKRDRLARLQALAPAPPASAPRPAAS